MINLENKLLFKKAKWNLLFIDVIINKSFYDHILAHNAVFLDLIFLLFNDILVQDWCKMSLWLNYYLLDDCPFSLFGFRIAKFFNLFNFFLKLEFNYLIVIGCILMLLISYCNEFLKFLNNQLNYLWLFRY